MTDWIPRSMFNGSAHHCTPGHNQDPAGSWLFLARDPVWVRNEECTIPGVGANGRVGAECVRNSVARRRVEREFSSLKQRPVSLEKHHHGRRVVAIGETRASISLRAQERRGLV